MIELHAECDWHGSDFSNVFVEVSSNNKQWCNDSSDGYVECNEYIGVTPNKQYTVTMKAEGEFGGDFTAYFYIKYSPEINNKTPTVTDY